MQKQFVPYDLSVKLKELGFDEECINFWYPSGTINNSVPIYGFQNWHKTNGYLNAPLWQQTFDWFRCNYNMNDQIRNNDRYYFININKIDYFLDVGKSLEINKPFKTYEEARLECLKKLIELCTH